MIFNEIKENIEKSNEVVFDDNIDGYIIKTDFKTYNIPWKQADIVRQLKKVTVKPKSNYESDLIFGKDKTEGIVSLEVYENDLILYKADGSVETRPTIYWILAPIRYDKGFKKLEGNQHYKYIKIYEDRIAYAKAASYYRKRGVDIFNIWNVKEAAMIYYGVTMFKGLKVKDVSVLSFDIESSGLRQDDSSFTFLITNTMRHSDGRITKKHFRVDNYDNDDVAMIRDWCEWVVQQDPTVITGHNIFGYDLPYLQYCYSERQNEKEMLPLGKNSYPISINKNPSSFRVDGSNSWDYHKIQITGRHIIDTMFLAVKYDVGRNFPSWGLKAIIEHEGLVKENRQFYDASKIKDNWQDPIEREKIVDYGKDDGDDALALYDLMIPSIFYMTQSVAKPFQLMGLSASGAQLNTIMIRAYMQDNHSIPKASEREYVAGGMSYGVPGIYKNVLKWDAKSFYPSTILTFNIYDKEKDPKAYYLQMVKYFTYKRFEQKDKYKETNDTYYNDLQAASKIFINSAYGLLGTSGLNYNSFENASLITKCCRAGLQKAIIWATGRDTKYWWQEYYDSQTSEQDFEDFSFIDQKAKVKFNDMLQHDWDLANIDTDALSFCKKDQSPYTKEEKEYIFKELNDIMYSEWEDDGEFDNFIILKAKNYITKEKGSNKIKLKGSSITDAKREPALREFIDDIIDDLIDTSGQNINAIYEYYIKQANNIRDINRWCTKKSITKAVLNPTRTNEQKIKDALKNRPIQEGDKVFLYSAIDGMKQDVKKGEPVFLKSGQPKMIENRILKLNEDWSDDEDKSHYTKRVYMTLDIFKKILDMGEYIKYHLKGNQSLLENL